METSSEKPTLFSLPDLSILAASGGGLWIDDASLGRFHGDAGFAKLCGLPAADVADGVSLRRVGRVVHPLDRLLAFDRRSTVLRGGGAFEMVLRTAPGTGGGRRLLWRGRYKRACAKEPVRGHGILIDVTQLTHGGRGAEGVTLFSQQEILRSGAALDRAVAHALAAREALGHAQGVHIVAPMAAVELLLFSLGRALGRELADGPD